MYPYDYSNHGSGVTMKRIRYVKTTNPNEIRSAIRFKTEKGALYMVKINTETNTYKVLNARSQHVVRSTEKDGVKPPKNLYTVYEQVKRALKSLGIKFEHEFRNLGE